MKFVVRKLPMPPLIAVVMSLPPVPWLIAWNVAVVPVVLSDRGGVIGCSSSAIASSGAGAGRAVVNRFLQIEQVLSYRSARHNLIRRAAGVGAECGHEVILLATDGQAVSGGAVSEGGGRKAVGGARGRRNGVVAGPGSAGAAAQTIDLRREIQRRRIAGTSRSCSRRGISVGRGSGVVGSGGATGVDRVRKISQAAQNLRGCARSGGVDENGIRRGGSPVEPHSRRCRLGCQS